MHHTPLLLTLEEVRDRAQAQSQRLEAILGERGQQVQELEEERVRAEDEVKIEQLIAFHSALWGGERVSRVWNSEGLARKKSV
jgi:hypothetical protein